MSIVDRAGLLVHEIIYEHFVRLGEDDSIKARKIVALLAHDKEFVEKNFWPLVQRLRLRIYP